MNKSTATGRIAAIQLNSGEDLQANLACAYAQLENAKQKGAYCAVLPENFAWMELESQAQTATETYGKGPVQDFLQQTARELQLWLIGGSHRIEVPDDAHSRAYNSCLVYDPQGERHGRYDKIHLFDADVNDGRAYRESDAIKAGRHASVINTGFAKIGLTICYDLRFPGLFHALRKQGADIIVVPAAFTATTGRAHWKALLRARAIENQVYIIASAQCGIHPYGRKTWGHSMCIDPWGKVLEQLKAKPGNIGCKIDRQKIADIRQKMPVLDHHRAPYD